MSLEEQIKSHVVPARGVTLWWLGQAGLVLKSPGGTVVVIDPYLTNSCKAIGDRYRQLEHGVPFTYTLDE